MVLAIALVLAARTIYFKPQIFRGVSEITENSPNLVIEYSKNSGSLPPPYYRESIFTISTDETGKISAEYTTRDYEKVLEKTSISISKEQLKKLLIASANIGKQLDEIECVGGSTKSIRILQNDQVLLNRDMTSCGGAPTDENLAGLFIEIERMAP